MKLIAYTDGGARGNPGPAGIGVVIYEDATFPLSPPREEGMKGRLLKKYSQFLGEKTNNEAEYEAVIAALKLASEFGADEVEIRLDSQLVARQLGSVYKIKNHRMQGLVLQVRNLESKFKKVSYKNIPREQNALADKLVNQAIDKHGDI